jgi:uncharacterized tellurite resistance protein B-like protein
METPHSHQDIVNDLALIYLAFAHGTDGELSDAEVGMIAERLLDWQEDGGREAIVASVRTALRTYNEADDDAPLQAAIDSIGMSVSREVRAFILDDLMDIALADDVFRNAESDFIKRLSDRWDVRPSEEIGATDDFTILDKGDIDGGWTPIHDLALVYLTVAHRPDRDLSIEEVEAITRKLSEWMPEKNDSEIFLIVQGAMNIYGDGADETTLHESIEALRRYVPEHQRVALIEDLEYVAKADGVVLDEERSLIEGLREALGVAKRAAAS